MNMIPADRALDLILENVPRTGRTTVSIRRACGHALARDVVSGGNVPPFDNAGMDGYAVRSPDIPAGGAVLKLGGEIAAGDSPDGALRAGEAIAVMTGAPLPPGADAVAEAEMTETGSDGEVRILRPVEPGRNIRKAGSDIPAGRKILAEGDLLRPYELAVLSSLGIGYVEVYGRPSVSLLPTGSELCQPGATPSGGMIRESVSGTLDALLRTMGCRVSHPGITPDDDAVLRERIREGLNADLLVTTGGVSAGRYDAIPRLLAEEGASVVFHRVNIKPGMPMLFAMAGTVPVFALPGNPVSAVVTFLEFVAPAVRRMSGETRFRERVIVRARLGVEIPVIDGKRHFQRGVYAVRDGEPVVHPAGAQGSSMVSVLAGANCLMILPEGRRVFRKSDYIDVELL